MDFNRKDHRRSTCTELKTRRESDAKRAKNGICAAASLGIKSEHPIR